MATFSMEIPADAQIASNGHDPLLEALRRLMRLADGDSDAGAVFGALARELCALLCAEEVLIHHLASAEKDEAVVAYLFGGDTRLGHALPGSERPPGVAWVASTGQPVVATGARELAASLPRRAHTGEGGSALLLALTVRSEVEAVVVLLRRLPERWQEHEMQRAAMLVDQAAAGLALTRARAEAGTDAVTGCMNHRAMRRRLREEIGRAARTDGQLACLLIDLDDFKQVNDRHGHPAGDAVLRGVARALMGEFRAFDRVARYGGDEFVVILPAADLQSAALAGDRALQRLAALATPECPAGVSASIGVAQWQPPMGVAQLLEVCDAALLGSKRAGKGRVGLAA
jgi:diguanylate cyclase (GGDEF)-like protein